MEINRLQQLSKHKTLILDDSYTPVAVVSWQRAIQLWTSGKGQMIVPYDEITVNSATQSFELPSVLKVNGLSRRKPIINFNRWGVFARDNFSCAYCGKEFVAKELSLDHIIPFSQGGNRNWENIISACLPCNQKKANQTPDQAGMRLLFKPYTPKWNPLLILKLNRVTIIDLWKPFLKVK